ncbi:hypothetical protein [Nonomuraea sp. NPDC049684]|uniref:hypothetical protein n=1 Tax=Nonomuraea sp. NPDC049684 TaxID=3364356 RepID=UPI0037930A68
MDIPGGYVEPGETRRLSPRRATVLFVFDGGTLDDGLLKRIRLADDELSAYESHPVEEADRLLIERLARRVKAVATARELGRDPKHPRSAVSRRAPLWSTGKRVHGEPALQGCCSASV